jgi:hypothetical protein
MMSGWIMEVIGVWGSGSHEPGISLPLMEFGIFFPVMCTPQFITDLRVLIEKNSPIVQIMVCIR